MAKIVEENRVIFEANGLPRVAKYSVAMAFKPRSLGPTTTNADGSPHVPISYDCAGCLTHAQLGGILRAAGLI